MLSISVVIAAYNAGRFIAEALASVLNQSRPPLEVIVVDDASTDNTREVVRSFLPKIRLIENTTNEGPGARRNQAARQASGDAIALLDADNRWEPNHLETVAGLLDRYPQAGVAFSRMRIFGNREGIWPNSIPCAGTPDMVTIPLLRHNFIELSSLLIRRDLFWRVGGFQSLPEKFKGRWVLADDYDLTLRMSLEAPFVGSEAVTVWYRRHDEQSSHYQAPLVRQAFLFRLKILQKILEDPRLVQMKDQAEDRIRLAWEEALESCWVERDVVGLRMLVKFGLQYRLLAPAAWRYAAKSIMPRKLAYRSGSRTR